MKYLSVQQILDKPNAVILVREAQKILAEEQKKREAFYRAIDEQEKVEFINGRIIRHSPIRIEHAEASLRLAQIMNPYAKKNKLGFVGIEKVMIALSRNDYEPDICFFKQERAKHFQKGQNLFPAPDWIIEILSPSTAKHDRETKFRDYALHGIEEYWIIDAAEEVVEQYHLEDEEYELVLKVKTGEIQSFTMEGFRIPVRAIFEDETNWQTLQKLMTE